MSLSSANAAGAATAAELEAARAENVRMAAELAHVAAARADMQGACERCNCRPGGLLTPSLTRVQPASSQLPGRS